MVSEAHAPVDGLGGERVAELVGMGVPDARLLGRGGDDAVDGASVERCVLVGHQALLGPDVDSVASPSTRPAAGRARDGAG